MLKRIAIFTDGSSCGNGKSTARAGVGIYIPLLEKKISSSLTESLRKSNIINTKNTNQRAELAAIIEALRLTKNETNGIDIYTDSMYSINCVTKWYKSWIKNNWIGSTGKPVLNQDIIRPIIESLKNKDISFHHVKAHKKAPSIDSELYFTWQGNYIADQLACSGSKINAT